MFSVKGRFYRLLNRIIPSDITQVLLLDLSAVQAPSSSVEEYSFDFITADELIRFSALEGAELKPEMAELIRSREAVCFAATVDGELAAYTWFAGGTVDAQHNCGGSQFRGIGLSLPDNMMYLFKAFVLPEHRGKSLNRWIYVRAGESFAKQDYHFIITTTDWTNLAFQRSAINGGFQRLALEGEFVVGKRHCYRLPKLSKVGVRLFGGAL